MIKTIIIDDESKALQALVHDLKIHCSNINILATCASAEEGIREIKSLKPGLVFLDIEMPGKNGFELLQSLDKIDFKIIFTTSYSKYAVDAFRLSAVVDYLLKPIDPSLLVEAVSRVSSLTESSLLNGQLEVLLENLGSANALKRIAFRTGKGLDLVMIQNIMYAQSNGSYINIFTKDPKKSKKTYCTINLRYLEDRLDSFGFCRIHQSNLINLNHMLNYNRSEHYVKMIDGEKLPVSKSGRTELKRKLGF